MRVRTAVCMFLGLCIFTHTYEQRKSWLPAAQGLQRGLGLRALPEPRPRARAAAGRSLPSQQGSLNTAGSSLNISLTSGERPFAMPLLRDRLHRDGG